MVRPSLAVPLPVALAATRWIPSAAQQPFQTPDDDYPKYELLAPDTAQFRIQTLIRARRVR